MKNLLLHIHDDDDLPMRLALTLDLARQMGSHIACVQVTPVEAYASDPYGGMLGMAALIDTIHDQDKALRLATEAQLQAAGVSWDWHSFDGNVVENLIDRSLLADVVIVSQPGQTVRRTRRQPMAIVGDLVIHVPCPVLMVPQGCEALDLAGPAMIAWNGSAEAAHAMRLGLPLLRRASAVHLVEVSDDAPGISAQEARTWLTRHGIAVDLHEWPAKGRRISVALQHAAAELSAHYLVMGAYGHSRLRETVLGGVTKELIASAGLPMLMAH
jgi:nucleotide-binding universal stress UspA family protein